MVNTPVVLQLTTTLLESFIQNCALATLFQGAVAVNPLQVLLLMATMFVCVRHALVSNHRAGKSGIVANIVNGNIIIEAVGYIIEYAGAVTTHLCIGIIVQAILRVVQVLLAGDAGRITAADLVAEGPPKRLHLVWHCL